MSRLHPENHLVERIGWLRAAVLGANDGIISTASLVVGVASASTNMSEILLAGTASVAAGAMAMAAGEYVSVSSQADTEKADIQKETRELMTDPAAELDELTAIYVSRGVEPDLARQVASQMMEKDALASHMRDELGISHTAVARPVQAAVTSALTFAFGASMPIMVTLFAPQSSLVYTVSIASVLFLAVLGAIGAKVGGAGMVKPALRVAFWGALAMATTAVIGLLVGKAL
jgi:vacuolar iron transporter family protein